MGDGVAEDRIAVDLGGGDHPNPFGLDAHLQAIGPQESNLDLGAGRQLRPLRHPNTDGRSTQPELPLLSRGHSLDDERLGGLRQLPKLARLSGLLAKPTNAPVALHPGLKLCIPVVPGLEVGQVCEEPCITRTKGRAAMAKNRQELPLVHQVCIPAQG